jgi:hypothetical protein
MSGEQVPSEVDGEPVLEVQEATDRLTPEEVREAQEAEAQEAEEADADPA